jgi:hypothetical protein
MTIQAQIEEVEARLDKLVRRAESGADWAEICRIEAFELRPLLNQFVRVS